MTIMTEVKSIGISVADTCCRIVSVPRNPVFGCLLCSRWPRTRSPGLWPAPSSGWSLSWTCSTSLWWAPGSALQGQTFLPLITPRALEESSSAARVTAAAVGWADTCVAFWWWRWRWRWAAPTPPCCTPWLTRNRWCCLSEPGWPWTSGSPLSCARLQSLPFRLCSRTSAGKKKGDTKAKKEEQGVNAGHPGLEGK